MKPANGVTNRMKAFKDCIQMVLFLLIADEFSMSTCVKMEEKNKTAIAKRKALSWLFF